jgi:hypothetical protein
MFRHKHTLHATITIPTLLYAPGVLSIMITLSHTIAWLPARYHFWLPFVLWRMVRNGHSSVCWYGYRGSRKSWISCLTHTYCHILFFTSGGGFGLEGDGSGRVAHTVSTIIVRVENQ